jgi:putative sugar O-methyltransferase
MPSIKQILNRIYVSTEFVLKNISDPNCQANSDIAKCVEDRIDWSGDDTALLRRISSAYIKASHDLPTYPEIFRPSNEWLPVYKQSYLEIIQALEKCDVSAIDKIYRNFWRETCSRGLVGLPVNMNLSYFGKKISFTHKALYLNDSIHRFNLWNKLLNHRYSVDSLISPLIGNPYGYFIDGKFIKAGADYQHYYAIRINNLLDEKQGKTVVAEIGGGFGGMAYYLIRDAKNLTYLDFDLPENLALTSYYLLKAFPEKKVLLYGEAGLEGANLADYDIVLMPSFQLDKLPEGTCDLIFNSYSLAEMSPQTINHYVLRSAKLIKEGGCFFHVNHTKQSLVSARDFPIPDNFALISEEFAAWNLGRNSRMDEYEFLYKKNY